MESGGGLQARKEGATFEVELKIWRWDDDEKID